MSRLLCAKTVCETAQKKKTVKNIRKKSVGSLIEMPPCGLIKTALREAFFRLLSEGHHLLCFTQLNRICRRKQQMKACPSPSVRVCAALPLVCVWACIAINPSICESEQPLEKCFASSIRTAAANYRAAFCFFASASFTLRTLHAVSDNTARPINENHTRESHAFRESWVRYHLLPLSRSHCYSLSALARWPVKVKARGAN